MAVNFSLMVGGEAGQGVQSVGAILAKYFARGGFSVFADQDYESRVRGGHNFFRIRVQTDGQPAIAPALDVLIALNKETVDLHAAEVKPGGVIIHDAAETGLKAIDARYLDVPFVKLAEEASGNKLMSNTVAAGAALGLLRGDFSLLPAVLGQEFARHGEKTVEDNVAAARAGYDFAREHGKSFSFPALRPPKEAKRRLLLNGNEAVAFGALAAGCKFTAGYPMTPSSSILEYIADKGLEHGAVMLHVEDEISALNMAVGAGYAGVRSMVATSGGGFALMVEALALAGMTETPVVVVLGQRPGPATGLPTRTEQGELLFSLHAGHGEFPRAVLAPADAADAFQAAVKAFNLAEKYQTPVIILTDHHLASSYATVDKFDLSEVNIERGALLSDAAVKKLTDYRRHAVTASGVSPRALPGQGKALVVTDSDEHDENGHMIEDAATRNQQVEKRLRKLAGLQKEITPPEFRPAQGAAVTLIGWGSTGGAIREAAALLKKDGKPVNTLHFRQVWPFPSAKVTAALKKAKKNIVVESNATGQLAQLIRQETGIKADGAILKYDGRPFSPQEIIDRLNREVKPW
ncbi:MAG: 2-oxoacid:acceptor oxidoreductase subunit alpha [Dehalococcoidales bacterium]|jgi:2-oxoglutarate ferredoxin oxidoreductase subunit alpha